jgi:hypothetical protein
MQLSWTSGSSFSLAPGAGGEENSSHAGMNAAQLDERCELQPLPWRGEAARNERVRGAYEPETSLAADDPSPSALPVGGEGEFISR